MSGIDPLINFRAVDEDGSELAFFEAHVIPGPEAVGDIGNGTQRERYGFNWLVMLTADRVPMAYREVPNGSGNWVQVTDLLPPVFGSVLPEGSRRLSAVFDQSGRIAICYEHEGLVRVTRWDVAEQDYVQNVTFPGTNPALATDLHAGIPVGDSDVQVYYQPVDDLTQVRCRIQRDLYLTVYTVWDGSVPLILDRAQVSALQLQLFVSDTMGNPLRDETGQLAVLAGPYYPFYVQDAVLLDAVPTVGIYEETTLMRGVQDVVFLDVTPTVADYVGNTALFSVQGHVMLDASPTVAEYRDNTHLESVADAVLLDATPTTAEYVQFIGANPKPVDHVILDATPTVAIYREA